MTREQKVAIAKQIQEGSAVKVQRIHINPDLFSLEYRGAFCRFNNDTHPCTSQCIHWRTVNIDVERNEVTLYLTCGAGANKDIMIKRLEW